MKKIFNPQDKMAVALEAIKEELTPGQIASKYEIHPQQVGRWKKEALIILKDGFSDKRKKENWDQHKLTDELYKTIGQRDIELTWLKKKLRPFGLPD
jgi:transposase